VGLCCRSCSIWREIFEEIGINADVPDHPLRTFKINNMLIDLYIVKFSITEGRSFRGEINGSWML